MKRISSLTCKLTILPAFPTFVALTELKIIRRYDNDDAGPSKDQIGVPSQPAPTDTADAEPIEGYGEEPDNAHDPTTFDYEFTGPDTTTNGQSLDSAEGKAAQDMMSEPGIQMKEDG